MPEGVESRRGKGEDRGEGEKEMGKGGGMRRWRLISLPRRNASAAPCPGQCLNSAAKPTALHSIALHSTP